MAQGAIVCECNATVVSSVPTTINISYFHFFALVSKQSAAPVKFDGIWGTKCPNTRFPLSATATYIVYIYTLEREAKKN